MGGFHGLGEQYGFGVLARTINRDKLKFYCHLAILELQGLHCLNVGRSTSIFPVKRQSYPSLLNVLWSYPAPSSSLTTRLWLVCKCCANEGKGRSSGKDKEPTVAEMHAVVRDILKEVDFNTVRKSQRGDDFFAARIVLVQWSLTKITLCVCRPRLLTFSSNWVRRVRSFSMEISRPGWWNSWDISLIFLGSGFISKLTLGILPSAGSHFRMDLMHRKAEVKSIIEDVINDMTDDEDDDGTDGQEWHEAEPNWPWPPPPPQACPSGAVDFMLCGIDILLICVKVSDSSLAASNGVNALTVRRIWSMACLQPCGTFPWRAGVSRHGLLPITNWLIAQSWPSAR